MDRFVIFDVDQRDEEWYNLRRGKITASNAHRLLTPAKFSTFKWELLAETLTEHPVPDTRVGDAAQRGIDLEDIAIEEYVKLELYDCDYYKMGFCISLDYPICGASPDLVVGDKGLAEFKCPNSENHLKYMTNGAKGEIIAQMQFQMWIIEREFNDFVTFDDRFRDRKLEIYTRHYKRDDDMIEIFKAKATEMSEFIEEFRMEHGV